MRNRNLIVTEKFVMPNMRADSLTDRFPGTTKNEPGSPLSKNSASRKQFFQKYLDSEADSEEGEIFAGEQAPNSKGIIKVRNMVYANKKERMKEKVVREYIIGKVLNQ